MMAIEEKAKAYDEALAIAKQVINNNCSEVEKLCLECVLPELKESEDERIRKTLLRCCDDWEKGQFGCMKKEDVPLIRAYLEKQKEEKSTLVEKLRSISTPADENWFEIQKRWEKEDEQKPAEWNPNNEDVTLFNKAVTTNPNLTPAERAKLDIIRMKFKHCNGNTVKPAEWSEKDKKLCQKTIEWLEEKCFPYALDDNNPARDCIVWLKSLRPESYWKPSEAEVKALEGAYLFWKGATNRTPDIRSLELLYDDLKKL